MGNAHRANSNMSVLVAVVMTSEYQTVDRKEKSLLSILCLDVLYFSVMSESASRENMSKPMSLR